MANLNVEVDTIDIIDSLIRSMDNEELADFIFDLDALLVDWNFTELLYRHFKTLHKEYKEEKKMLKELYE